jgi:hypothetical protein
VVMWGRKRQRALEARLDRLAGKVVVIETLGGTVIGLMLRAVPDNLRDGVLRDLRKSITTRSEGATSADAEQTPRPRAGRLRRSFSTRSKGSRGGSFAHRPPFPKKLEIS